MEKSKTGSCGTGDGPLRQAAVVRAAARPHMQLCERTAAKMILLVNGKRTMGSPRQEGSELLQPAGGLFQRGFCGTTVATTRHPVRQTRPPRRPRGQCAVSATLSGIDRVAAEVAPNWLIGTPQPDRGRSTTEPHDRQGAVHLRRVGNVLVSWLPCECLDKPGGGHRTVLCQACGATWYDPPHDGRERIPPDRSASGPAIRNLQNPCRTRAGR